MPLRTRPLTLAALTGLVLLAGLLPRGVAAGPASPELKKLHVLLVFDTDSNLQEGLKIDLKNVKALLARNIPKGMYSEKVLEGKDVSKEKILAYYRDLKVGKDEGLLLFYGGHGGTLSNRHFLALHSGRLFRDELSKAMEARGAGLTVILTDCCSDKVKLKRSPVVNDRPGDLLKVPTPVFRNLFFRPWGTVDITAATNDKAYGDDWMGGLFTRGFCRSLEFSSIKAKQPVVKEVLARLDDNKDGMVTWQEYFPALRDDTTGLFKSWTDDPGVRGDPDLKRARPQIPQAFKLGTQPGGPNTTKGTGFLVVSLINKTDKALVYEYRWSGDSAWKEGKLAPNAQAYYFKKGDSSAQLEARLKGSENISHLEPARWSGNGNPAFKDGKLYNWKPRK